MNKKGFTLVELLAVIVLMSLVLVITISSVQSGALKTKVKLCNTKKEIIKNTVNLWSKNNQNCFLPASNGCDILTNCSQSGTSIYKCNVTLDTLAVEGILNYDDNIESKIINPVNESAMNDTLLTITYDRKNKLATTEIIKTKLASGFYYEGEDEAVVKELCSAE